MITLSEKLDRRINGMWVKGLGFHITLAQINLNIAPICEELCIHDSQIIPCVKKIISLITNSIEK